MQNRVMIGQRNADRAGKVVALNFRLRLFQRPRHVVQIGPNRLAGAV